VAKPKTEKKTRDKAAAPKAAAAASVPAKGGKAKALDGVVETPGVPEEKPYDPSAWMHERVARRIMEFEKNLGPDHEIGGRFVEGPTSEPLHITNVASWGPDMILFMGEFADGRTFELIQHYSQVSVLLVAVKKMNDEPRRIGFELIKTVREQDHAWEDPVS
jgi:hypothetical protein